MLKGCLLCAFNIAFCLLFTADSFYSPCTVQLIASSMGKVASSTIAFSKHSMPGIPAALFFPFVLFLLFLLLFLVTNHLLANKKSLLIFCLNCLSLFDEVIGCTSMQGSVLILVITFTFFCCTVVHIVFRNPRKHCIGFFFFFQCFI